MTSQSAKKENPLTVEFANKYFRMCKAMGKTLNGMERAKFLMTLKQNNTEEILDICKMIETWEKQQLDFPSLTRAAPIKEQPIQAPVITSIGGSSEPNMTIGGNLSDYWSGTLKSWGGGDSD